MPPSPIRPSPRWFLATLGLLYALLALASLGSACSGHGTFGFWACGFWMALAVGVWRRGRPALWMAVAMHGVLVAVLPLGLLNPMAAMDGLWGSTPRPASTVLLWVLALSAVNLAILFRLREALKGKARAPRGGRGPTGPFQEQA